jgi:hypothetical protein
MIQPRPRRLSARLLAWARVRCSAKRWRQVGVLLASTAVVLFAVSAQPQAQPSSGFELGVVGGRDPLLQPRQARRLGARVVRVEFSIDQPAARIAPLIGAYARAGARVLLLAGFIGRVPSAAEAAHLASWAAAFGPSGTYWRRHPGGTYAVREIEFGSETSYAYQFGGCGSGCSGYRSRARAYALAFVQAQQAIAGPGGNSGVGLLAQADYGGMSGSEWVGGMFDAVPDLARHVAGWTVHAYGPPSRWRRSIDALISQTRARGAPASIPIDITELGIASDNGRCLSDNYGWSPCMTYAEAGQALRSTIVSIRQRYGQRLRSIFVYQLADQRPPGHDSNREDYFGVLRANSAPKGAFTTTVRSLLAAYP